MAFQNLEIRKFVHVLVDRLPEDKLLALLDLLDEDYFSEEEIKEIEEQRSSTEWVDWRTVRHNA